MPYVIATTARRTLDSGGSTANEVLSRRAVATLEAARNEIADTINWTVVSYGAKQRLIGTALEVPESGGTVGPLPDGTVIEVERLYWDELRAVAKVPSTTSDAGTINAYNARQT